MEEKSKSERKREVEALQQLAISISKLTEGLLAQIPLPAELKNAILAYKKMTAHGALRRQAQFLGKLMREVDTDPIIEAYKNIQQQHQRENQSFHQIEIWRDRLLSEDKTALTDFINQFPDISTQELRQLITKAKKAGAHRELFRFLKQQLQNKL